jgi:hypothetical protein
MEVVKLKLMNDEEFWKILSLLNWKKLGNDDKVIAPAIKYLSKLSVDEIEQFEETLSYKLYLIDTKEHAKNIGEYALQEDSDDYFSEDWFLYAGCTALTSGEAFYKKVLTDPTQIPKDCEFEALLSIAMESYERKTGDDFLFTPEYSYETYSNREGWSL